MNGPGDPVLEMTVAYRCPRCMRLYTSMADYHAHRGICSLDERWVGKFVSYDECGKAIFGKVTRICVDECEDDEPLHVEIDTLMAHIRRDRSGCTVDLVYEGTSHKDSTLREVTIDDVRRYISDALSTAVSGIVENVTGFGTEEGSE